MDRGRRSGGGRRDGGRRGRDPNPSFSRARERFERKRKTDNYDYNDQKNYTVPGNGRGYDVNGGQNDSRMDYDDERDGRQRRSRSPSRWERGKKQQKKTQTDVPPDRELFVGNIPSDVDDKFLLHFLNGAMRQAKLCLRHESPCLSAQINTGNFAFVEMLNPEFANKCLNINGVLFLNARIKVGRPKKYAGPFVVQKNWQELTGTELTIDAVLDGESEKVNRELFVGNTTPEMTDQMLKDFLGSAMGQVGLTIMDGNPITLCEMFGKYAFIELRTPRETTNALNLNNIEFMNSKLQITRPAKYQGVFEEHMNWEQVLARYGVKPEEFQLGQVLNSTALLTSSAANAELIDGEDINVVKAQLAQVKQALQITRHQLDECNKKSEARKEQLISLNKKWAEGKSELSDHKSELDQVRGELKNKSQNVTRVSVDMDSRMEAAVLKKKHEETQGMLRGVTESLLKATEKLQNERKARKSLEVKFKEANFSLNLGMDAPAPAAGESAAPAAGGIDFAGLRSELNTDGNTEMGDHAGGMEIDTAMEEEDEPQMESLKDFLAKTPKTNIDWGANAAATPASIATPTPRARDRAGVRLCRLLIRTDNLNANSAKEVQGMAGKYNLGGFIQSGKPGMIIVEGLEFNCDIFMDNLERQKQSYVSVGKVSERSGRCFPMELTVLNGDSSISDFAKACESVGLKEKLEAAMSS
uniref:RRM domain-containing protein n=1 Tax=Pseudo-nitzschia delicatissima TaxID=44447 RepID=A0A7S0UH60_9STRA|mmetsp:Transcript_100/g.234  ORF Transcript_100/g.234 Transcript_100/m.234 type:complete len:700 (+) Transcript_100:342-2441(+)